VVRKQKMPLRAAQALVLAYSAWPVIPSDAALVGAAIETSIAHRLSIWDAMVIEAAQRADAQTLYTEDLNHGQRYGRLAIVNPFLG
jgi:predicted nucleic acid-binding protein